MNDASQHEQFAREGWALFEGALAGGALQLLREACAAFVNREDARMDSVGVDALSLQRLLQHGGGQ